MDDQERWPGSLTRCRVVSPVLVYGVGEIVILLFVHPTSSNSKFEWGEKVQRT